MRSPIRRVLYSRLLAAIFASGLLTGLGCVTAGVLLFRGYMDRALAASEAEALKRVEVFNLVIGKVVRDQESRGTSALKALDARFADRASARAAGLEGLRAVAAELGVDEVYFIGDDGRVFATSFEPDQGLDLFSFGGPTELLLKALYGSGRLESPGITGSTQTGNINDYQYFGPAGKDFVIEVSSRLSSMIGRAYPGHDYGSLAAALFGADRASGPVSILDYLDRAGNSWIHERASSPETAERLAASAGTPDSLEWTEGRHRLFLKRINLPSFHQAMTLYVLLRADESYYYGFIVISLVVALVVLGGSSFAAFLAARKSLGPKVTSRLESLSAAMGRVGKGGDLGLLDDRFDDEISDIGRSAAEMVSTILADREELRALARRLEEEIVERERKGAALENALDANRELLREVDHRVKNNLQFMASLARLEAGRAAPETARVLAKMELRFLGMAQVQDLIGAEPQLGRIEMAGILEDLVDRVAQQAGWRGAAVRISAEARLRADDATAAALAACELADNAFRHAMPKGRGGFELRLVVPSEGGFVMEAEDEGSYRGGPVEEGLGLTIVRALAAQRGGRAEFGPSGRGGFLAKVVVPPASA
ncbi:MAG: sensor histidine kinase [Spirochaetaceae bacterium]|nr:sensor histidine kinase [Spirochaetaceae bacterium]